MIRAILSGWVLMGCGWLDNPTEAPTENPRTDPTNPDPDPEPDPDPDPDPDPEVIDLTGLSWERNATFGGPFDVAWTQSGDATVYVEYQIDGSWRRTPDLAGVTGENTATVIGVPFGTTASWGVTVAASELRTDAAEPLEALPVPAVLPAPELLESDAKLLAGAGEHVLLPINDGPADALLVVLDRQARAVWATPASRILYAELSSTGEGILWGDVQRDRAYRAYLDELIVEVETPGHYHAMVGLPDGTIVWDSGSRLYELAPGATTRAEVWRHPDISYLNGITYDPITDRYVVSSFTAQSVAMVDRSAAEVDWSAPGFSDETVYGFQPARAQLDNQHGIEVQPNGNLLASTYESTTGTVWLREYVVDDTAEALRLVWEFDSGYGDVSWSWANRLDNGNTLHTLGPEGRLYEVTPDGEVVWRVEYDNWLGRAQIIDDLYDLVAPERPL